MTTLGEVFDEIKNVNKNLNTVQSELNDVKTKLDALRSTDEQGFSRIDGTLNTGFLNISDGIRGIIQLQIFVGKTLAHQSQQNDTMICILEQISRNTCSILNEAHEQTRLQQNMSGRLDALTEMFQSVYPKAALDFHRQDALERKIRECCPEPVPPLSCTYLPCPPPTTPQPPEPDVQFQVFQPGTPAPPR
jgi:hypothetical protein